MSVAAAGSRARARGRGADVLGIDLGAENSRSAERTPRTRGLRVDYRCVDASEPRPRTRSQLRRQWPASRCWSTCPTRAASSPRAPGRAVPAARCSSRPSIATRKALRLRSWRRIRHRPRCRAERTSTGSSSGPPSSRAIAGGRGLDLRELTGLHLNPLTTRYRLGDNVDVNYFALRAASAGG